MNTMSHDLREERSILVEGPNCEDAEFAGQWLLAAAEADRLLRENSSSDLTFQVSKDRLEVIDEIAFAPPAMEFLFLWLKDGFFSLDIGDAWVDDFAVMAWTGFFTRTGDRYQMTIPKDLKIEAIRNSLLESETLLTTMTQQEALHWTLRLDRLPSVQRVADRNALLAE